MMYGKRLMDEFDAARQMFLDQDAFEQAGVMNLMENAVNNVMHGLPPQEVRAAVYRSIDSSLSDERLGFSEVERAVFAPPRRIVDEMPL